MARHDDAPSDDAPTDTRDHAGDSHTGGDHHPGDDRTPDAIAVAINVKTRDVYVVTGPDGGTYPVELDAVRGDGSLEVRGDVHKAHLAMLGYHFLGAEIDSDEGRELRELVAQLRETDDDVVEILERRLRARGLLDE